jgi:hypothetical protein
MSFEVLGDTACTTFLNILRKEHGIDLDKDTPVKVEDIESAMKEYFGSAADLLINALRTNLTSA